MISASSGLLDRSSFHRITLITSLIPPVVKMFFAVLNFLKTHMNNLYRAVFSHNEKRTILKINKKFRSKKIMRVSRKQSFKCKHTFY